MKINENGLQLDSFEDIFSNLANGFKAVYGEDINLAQDTADGQVVGIFANTTYDLQTHIARIYNALDPDFAEGHELDKILKLIATTRLPSTKSTVDISVEVSKNVTLPSDYTIKDINEQEWIITQEQTLTTGTTTVSFEAKEWGKVEAIANTITNPVTILTEVISVNNPLSAVAGRDEEDDISLRNRRNKLIGYRATSLVSSMLGKILNLENVTDAIIYENYEDTHDDVKDIDAHTMWVIIDGGEINEIAEVIATDKTVGCGLKGLVNATYTETFIRSNGTERTHIHEVKFDRPTLTNASIRFKVKKRNANDVIDTEKIKEVLEQLHFNIAQNITATELYATIYQAGNTFIAYDLELSKDDGDTWVDDILEALCDEKFIIGKDDIDITEE